MKIVDADEVAQMLGVCRRTVLSAAGGNVEYLGNKAFIRSKTSGVPVRGKHKTLQQVADQLGCSRSTVLRVVKRTGLGIQIGGRRYIPESQIGRIKKSILARGVTQIHCDRKAMSERGRMMAQARWG